LVLRVFCIVEPLHRRASSSCLVYRSTEGVEVPSPARHATSSLRIRMSNFWCSRFPTFFRPETITNTTYKSLERCQSSLARLLHRGAAASWSFIIAACIQVNGKSGGSMVSERHATSSLRIRRSNFGVTVFPRFSSPKPSNTTYKSIERCQSSVELEY
jgi:hypothetical protein